MEVDEPKEQQKTFLESIYEEENGYDSERDGSRPIKKSWPEDSQLDRSHFTIDEQQCLLCKKKLGYAMPMNKEPNVKFLYCLDSEGNDVCRDKAVALHCWSCGNYNTEATGCIVFRTGNSAFDGPSQIYEFMCYHCHKEMKENEPGLAECKRQMELIRAARKEDELRSKGIMTCNSYETGLVGKEGKKRKLE